LIFCEIDTFLTVIECHLQFIWVWVDTIPFYMSLHDREVRGFLPEPKLNPNLF